IGALMPSGPGGPAAQESAVRELPGFLHEPFAAALSQSLLLPAFVALFGVIAALFFIGGMRRRIEGPSFSPAEAVTDPIPVHEGWDDDFYFEY
ncbi:MAG: MFS transporter, partial [Mycobacterium sp.]|nr:MFS transporter [Mycobacterium sp.]